MKVPMVEITESLGIQNSGKAISELSGILWALHPKGKTLAACFGTNVSVFLCNSRNSDKNKDESLLSRLSAINVSTGLHKITAISWLVNIAQRSQKDNNNELDAFSSHLMIGNEKGEFMVYDLTGECILHQKLHNSSILQIRCRISRMGLENNSIEDISVVFSEFICRIPLPELCAFIRLHEAGSGQLQDPSLQLAYGKFSSSKNAGGRMDGFSFGIQLPSLKDELKMTDPNQESTKIGIVSVGKSPAIGMFEATVAGSDAGALAFIGKMASAVAWGLPSMAWRNGRKAWRRGVNAWWSGNKEEERTPAIQTTLQSSLRDSKRQLLSFVPSPQDSLAVSTDSLGRILLIDIKKGLVLRIWKGYREAQCAWITRKQGEVGDLQLYLVIFARKRKTVEVWPMRYGPRSWSLFTGSNIRLLPTVPPMGLENAKWEVNCFVLDYENEEIWKIDDKAFLKDSDSNVHAVWDMMITQDLMDNK